MYSVRFLFKKSLYHSITLLLERSTRALYNTSMIFETVKYHFKLHFFVRFPEASLYIDIDICEAAMYQIK